MSIWPRSLQIILCYESVLLHSRTVVDECYFPLDVNANSLASSFVFSMFRGLNDGVSSSPKIIHLEHVSVTFFGIRVFADVIKLKISR